jgi:hypothetical protein
MIRSITVVGLLFFWTVAPALACLPNQQMSAAEMASCKKMAGDCHMGTGQHPCCTTKPKVNSPVATVQPVANFHPASVVVPLGVSFQPEPLASREVAQAYLGLPPPAPPGPNSILRI